MSLVHDSTNGWSVKLGSYTIRLEKDELNEDDKKKALKELRETPENVERGLRELKKLLAGEFLDFSNDCPFRGNSEQGRVPKSE